MNIHFIAIGGAVMHNMAIALHLKGENVTGSDDEIFNPSKSRLKKYGLLPEKWGWFPEKISKETDVIILGMHAREDNPELKKAQDLGIKIYSFPEYVYEQSKNKTRIVIGGSHGKTTITSMILHVLKYHNVECDYMVGAQLEGFEVMVRFSETAKYTVIEGDEYLTSPIDRRPKFHLYKPDIALISGIAWDHVNVFPTFENYVEQFKIFINQISANGTLVHSVDDEEVNMVSSDIRNDIIKSPYTLPDHEIIDGISYIKTNSSKIKLKVFGDHNLKNIMGAKNVCEKIGIDENDFFKAISSFDGASKRLEKISSNKNTNVYKDFAHSPSKLLATAEAVKKQFEDRELVACMELHTFSSLSEGFLSEYHGAMDGVHYPIVYFDPHALAMKKLTNLTAEMIKKGFGNDNIIVYNNSDELKRDLLAINWNNKNLLLMSSGNFGGIEVEELAESVVAQ